MGIGVRVGGNDVADWTRRGEHAELVTGLMEYVQRQPKSELDLRMLAAAAAVLPAPLGAPVRVRTSGESPSEWRESGEATRAVLRRETCGEWAFGTLSSRLVTTNVGWASGQASSIGTKLVADCNTESIQKCKLPTAFS